MSREFILKLFAVFLINFGGDELLFWKDGNCIAGKISKEREEVLLGYKLKFFKYKLGDSSFSYTVVDTENFCISGVSFYENKRLKGALLKYRDSVIDKKVFYSDGDVMVWSVSRNKSGFLVAGGIKRKNWDCFLAYFDENFNLKRALSFNGFQEYFYSCTEFKEKTYCVGRIKYKENWDGLIVELSENGKVLSSFTVGSKGKDYFRHVKVIEGKLFAIGRSEEEGNSDVLIYDILSGNYYLYDIGEYDYGRAIEKYGNGYIVAGETRINGDGEGFFLLLDEKFNPLRAYIIGGYENDGVRYLDNLFFVGYTYSYSFTADGLAGIFSENFKRVKVKRVFRKLNLRKVNLKLKEEILRVEN